MGMRLLLVLMIFGLLLATLSSCLSVKPSSSKGAGKDYEVFYLGDHRDQFFIKPIAFQAEGAALLLDITFRHPSGGDSAIVNFTLNTEVQQARVRSFELKNELANYKSSTEPEVLFTTQSDNGEFQARYSLSIPSDQIETMLEEKNWKVVVLFHSAKKEFVPTRKAQRTINRLVDQLGSEINSTPVHFFTD
ncbi:MAG: hypothetical protein EA409_02805 [Saprospirales bacterium]|nr:MAG: hypothetical protein EA409_02805 [Saprospirales bacterium]